MRWSVTTSFLLHTAILLACVIALPNTRPLDAELPPTVPVELLTLGDISKRQAVSKDAPEKPAEKIAPPKPKEVAEKPKPKPEPETKKPSDAVKQPAAEKKPEQPVKQAEAEPKPEPQKPQPPEPPAVSPDPEPVPEKAPTKEAEAKPAPKPKAKPKPPAPKVVEQKKKKPEQDFNPDDIAALLNKIPDAPKSAQEMPVEDGTPRRAEQTSLIGSDNAITADEVEWLRNQIQRCWSPPTGLAEAPNLVVKLRIGFNIDGSVNGYPQVVNSSASPLFQVAAEAAIRAVLGCQNYTMPPEKYESWRDVILNFDPRHMFPS
jgi:outer membrane biosynthesis protein TonB